MSAQLSFSKPGKHDLQYTAQEHQHTNLAKCCVDLPCITCFQCRPFLSARPHSAMSNLPAWQTSQQDTQMQTSSSVAVRPQVMPVRAYAMQEVEIALAEDAFQKDKAQLAEIWAQRTQQFQQAVDLQVCSRMPSSRWQPRASAPGGPHGCLREGNHEQLMLIACCIT